MVDFLAVAALGAVGVGCYHMRSPPQLMVTGKGKYAIVAVIQRWRQLNCRQYACKQFVDRKWTGANAVRQRKERNAMSKPSKPARPTRRNFLKVAAASATASAVASPGRVSLPS